ncbi:T9SS type A sorting domain-containing protein [Flavobacterium sp.]|uniref:T9SS type A sorting domain-containing protein n=1 Tax=Flavobacterium sp. TaxID=239 RepID=UPI0031DDCDB3
MKQVLHNPLIILLLLVSFNLYSQVTITTNNLKVDDKPISNNTISFNSNESVYVSLNIHLQTSNSSINNIFGNLFLYYQKNAEDIPTQIGFQSVTFYLNTYYINDTPFDITLLKGGFFESGGILYAEYKSNDNKTYQSNKISITGGSLPSSPPVIVPTNEAIPTQNLKYSDDFAIVNSKIFVTPDTPTFIDIEVYAKKDNDAASVGISLIEMNGNTINKTIPLKGIWIAPNNSYYLLKDIKIDPTILNFTQYTYTLKAVIQNYRTTTNPQLLSSKSDYIYKDNNKISILLTKPIEYNTIADNQTLSSKQISTPFTSLSPRVNYTINCEQRGCTPIYDYRDVNNFQWQTRTQNTNWTNIPQVTQKDYSPNKAFTESTYYRRVAFYIDGQYNISNTISIITKSDDFQNTICCDQQLPLTTSQPQEINGNIPNLTNFSYQWQIWTNPSAPTPEWNDLANATNQNYKHNFTLPSSRFTQITLFRRLIKVNSLVISTSNTIEISRPRPLATMNFSTSLDSNEFDTNKLLIYPNPTTDNVYIDGFVNIELLNLYDSYGAKINIDKNQKSTNLIEISTSKLQPGIYILKIDNTTYSKTIIKN